MLVRAALPVAAGQTPSGRSMHALLLFLPGPVSTLGCGCTTEQCLAALNLPTATSSSTSMVVSEEEGAAIQDPPASR